MNEKSQFTLLREKRFGPFFITQFLGAFNDNILKNGLVFLLTYKAASYTTLDGVVLANLCGAIFILPFLLFSASAGQLADKFEKSRMIRLIKLFEIVIMICATVGFIGHSLTLLLVALFMMGVHSTLFGPIKYAILPQQLKEDELIGGNGLIEMGTFVAILVGEILGPVLVNIEPHGSEYISVAAIAVAILGWWSSRSVPVAQAAAPDLKINWNLFTETWRNLSFASRNRTVFLCMLGNSWFWFYGFMMLTQFPAFNKDILFGNENVAVLLLTLFSVGVGAGSLLCEKLSGHKVEIGLVPFGSIGLTVFAADLYFASRGLPPHAPQTLLEFINVLPHWRVMIDLVLIGMFGGFYIVPLFALLQTRTDPAHRSRVIAGNNIINALFMIVAAVVAVVFLKVLKLSIPQLFLATALLNGIVAIYIYTQASEFLIGFLSWSRIRSKYK